MAHTAALAHALAFVQSSAPGGNVELLRRESLGGLSAEATARLLSRAYSAFLPVTPMPGPPLPLQGANLVNFGPTVESVTPWMQLVLGKVGECGMPGLVFLCGQRVWRLPPQLERATHVLIWPWDSSLTRSTEVPVPVAVDFLMLTLNDYLSRTAVLVQPLETAVPPGEALGGIHGWRLDIAHVALPLPPSMLECGDDTSDLLGVSTAEGEEAIVVAGAGELLRKVVTRLGLSHGIGYVRLLRLSDGSSWVPLDVNLGLPLFSVQLCRQVCSNASKMGFLSAENLENHAKGLETLQRHLSSLLSQHTCVSQAPQQSDQSSQGERASGDGGLSFDPKSVDLPVHNMAFSGTELKVVDLRAYVQDLWQA